MASIDQVKTALLEGADKMDGVIVGSTAAREQFEEGKAHLRETAVILKKALGELALAGEKFNNAHQLYDTAHESASSVTTELVRTLQGSSQQETVGNVLRIMGLIMGYTSEGSDLSNVLKEGATTHAAALDHIVNDLTDAYENDSQQLRLGNGLASVAPETIRNIANEF